MARSPVRDRPAYCDDLDKALDHIWSRLEAAVADRDDPYRLPGVATIAPDGAPTVRTVCLRDADRAAWRLRFHTDSRSAKAAQLAADPRVMLLFYDPVEKLQIRASGLAELHRDDETARAAWAVAQDFSRRTYFVEPGPGTPWPEPTSGMPDDPAAFAQQEKGFAVFMPVDVRLGRLEWLHLAARGQRRAAYDRQDGRIAASWLIP